MTDEPNEIEVPLVLPKSLADSLLQMRGDGSLEMRIRRILVKATGKPGREFKQPPQPIPAFTPKRPNRQRQRTPEEKATRLEEITDELKGESDRGFVLVLHCHIDHLISDMFRAHAKRKGVAEAAMNELLANTSSFRGRVRIAGVFDVIPSPLAEALLEFNELRNDVAHADQKFQVSMVDVRAIAKHLGADKPLDQVLVERFNVTPQSEGYVAKLILSTLLIELARLFHRLV